MFATNTERPLETFIDSSWGTRFSVSGCMVFFHGCLFHWFSKMQRSVSLSSAEAEFFGGRGEYAGPAVPSVAPTEREIVPSAAQAWCVCLSKYSNGQYSGVPWT